MARSKKRKLMTKAEIRKNFKNINKSIHELASELALLGDENDGDEMYWLDEHFWEAGGVDERIHELYDWVMITRKEVQETRRGGGGGSL